jgi:hypothetical protein
MVRPYASENVKKYSLFCIFLYKRPDDGCFMQPKQVVAWDWLYLSLCIDGLSNYYYIINFSKYSPHSHMFQIKIIDLMSSAHIFVMVQFLCNKPLFIKSLMFIFSFKESRKLYESKPPSRLDNFWFTHLDTNLHRNLLSCSVHEIYRGTGERRELQAVVYVSRQSPTYEQDTSESLKYEVR